MAVVHSSLSRAVIGGLLFPLVCGAMALSANDKPARNEAAVSEAQQPRVWGAPAGGLATALTSSGARLAVGDPVPVRLWVKNVSQQVLEVEHCGFWPNHYLRVTDAAGREVPTTKQGAAVRREFKKPSLRKDVPVTVEPGGIDAAYESYDLRDFFELPRGQIHVECESWLGGRKLLSNRLSLNIERS